MTEQAPEAKATAAPMTEQAPEAKPAPATEAAPRTPAPYDRWLDLQGWPEYGELDGQQVRITPELLDGTPGHKLRELVVDFGQGPTRPFRFGSTGDEIRNEPGKPLGI